MSAKQKKSPKKQPSETKGRGRPTKQNSELIKKICDLIGLGLSNRQAAESVGIDRSTLYQWLADDSEFSDQYAKACQKRCHHWADELLEIADDGLNDWVEREKEHGEMHLTFNGEHFQRSRLRVDTRKWALSKLMPKVYGDKLDVEHSGEIHISVTVGEKK